MSNKHFLALPVTGDTFAEIREKNRYYVDKTPYLKTVFSEDEAVDDKSLINGTTVLLLTRPRRFGKTLLMNMFESFLKISANEPGNITKHLNYFKGTKILEDKEFCKKYMGQFPVISISLKGVHGKTFKAAYFKLAELIVEKAKEFSFLENSPALDEDDKETYANLKRKSYLRNFNDDAISDATSAIASLASMLYKHFNKQVYVLIDEYDVPLAKAQDNNYHKEMVELMSSFLDFLKDPQKDPEKDTSIISKVILTGCLKVAKNSIFTGVNNLKVNTVTSENENLTGIIGFTKEETLKTLQDYEMGDFKDVVKNNYDGYKFYDKEMFCPWDVLNFIDENFTKNQKGQKNKVDAANYWAGSSSNTSLYEYLGFLTDSDNQKMQDLVDGNSISFILNETMNYDCLSKHDTNDFWSLLLHTGYLTLDWEKTDEDELVKDNSSNKEVYVRIPNLEIQKCFKEDIQKRFGSEFIRLNLHNKLVQAFACGKQVEITNIFFDMLQKYVSIRDTATKAPLENYYHGFINGIFTSCEKLVSEYHSNYEAGNGYPDITFKAERNTKAVIIEIKATTNDEEMDELAAKALAQIEDKNYALPFTKQSKITEIYAYGIVFCKKDCLVVCKKLK